MTTADKMFHWIPRVICITAILFISLFAADSFAPGLTIWQQITGFIIHLIPSFILTAFLILAWKHELAGGIIIAATGIIMSPLIYSINHTRNQFSVIRSVGIVLIIALPFIIVGVLFIISHFRKKRAVSKDK